LPSVKSVSYMFTKSLHSSMFNEFRSSLNICGG
jgi:hypothetical protein